MSCDRCGAACQGARCRDCERIAHQEDYYGVPADHVDDADAERGGWAVQQQGLDGEPHTGQATLDGIAKDGGPDD